MRNILPTEILYNIFEFSENKNLILLNKDINNYYLKNKEIFVNNLKYNPIELKYRLIRWKKRVDDRFEYRPSMYVESEQIYTINNENTGLKIGKIYDKFIDFSEEFENKLIPVSTLKESHTRHSYAGSVTYWTLKEVTTDNYEILKKYNFFFN